MGNVHKLDREKFDDFKKYLKKEGFKFERRPYQVFLARYDKFTVSLYESGKVVVAGKNQSLQNEIEWFLSTIGGKDQKKEESLGFEGRTRIGTDEVGKGDFFGPLVVAGAMIDRKSETSLLKAGVKDSKRIKSDKRMLEISLEIKRILGAKRIDVVTIRPDKYNDLYSKIGNLNELLGWAHARAIENLLKKNKDCKLAISDQFGDSNYIASSLMEKGRAIELIQIHKGGRDVAVASASIMARARFISEMERMSEKFDFQFPRGATETVFEAAKKFILQHGVPELGQVAKLHFSTTQRLDQKSAEGEIRTPEALPPRATRSR